MNSLDNLAKLMQQKQPTGYLQRILDYSNYLISLKENFKPYQAHLSNTTTHTQASALQISSSNEHLFRWQPAGNSRSSGRCFRKTSHAVKRVNLLISIMASENGLEKERTGHLAARTEEHIVPQNRNSLSNVVTPGGICLGRPKKLGY